MPNTGGEDVTPDRAVHALRLVRGARSGVSDGQPWVQRGGHRRPRHPVPDEVDHSTWHYSRKALHRRCVSWSYGPARAQARVLRWW